MSKLIIRWEHDNGKEYGESIYVPKNAYYLYVSLTHFLSYLIDKQVLKKLP